MLHGHELHRPRLNVVHEFLRPQGNGAMHWVVNQLSPDWQSAWSWFIDGGQIIKKCDGTQFLHQITLMNLRVKILNSV